MDNRRKLGYFRPSGPTMMLGRDIILHAERNKGEMKVSEIDESVPFWYKGER